MWFDPDHWIVCCDETAEDEFIFRRAAKKAGIPCEISFFKEGSEAYKVLKAESANKGGAPSIIFIRYQLNDCTGQNLIRFLQTVPGLQKVPIVFMTSPSNDDQFFSGSVPAGATIVYEKLISPETFTEVEEILRHAAEKKS
jgi:CheY-like chemotaxis protein